MQKAEIDRKVLASILKDLVFVLDKLSDHGHSFWHCGAVDSKKGLPFYYFQRHTSVDMSTCSTCAAMMSTKRSIRIVQGLLGLEQVPLKTRYGDFNQYIRDINTEP